jgi:hypothetical protein
VRSDGNHAGQEEDAMPLRNIKVTLYGLGGELANVLIETTAEDDDTISRQIKDAITDETWLLEPGDTIKITQEG